jgi:hypothetical protein
LKLAFGSCHFGCEFKPVLNKPKYNSWRELPLGLPLVGCFIVIHLDCAMDAVVDRSARLTLQNKRQKNPVFLSILSPNAQEIGKEIRGNQ